MIIEKNTIIITSFQLLWNRVIIRAFLTHSVSQCRLLYI